MVVLVVVVVKEWEMPEQWCPSMRQAEHEERMEACRRSRDGAFRGPSGGLRGAFGGPLPLFLCHIDALMFGCIDLLSPESPPLAPSPPVRSLPLRHFTDLTLAEFLTRFHTPPNSCTVSFHHSDAHY